MVVGSPSTTRFFELHLGEQERSGRIQQAGERRRPSPSPAHLLTLLVRCGRTRCRRNKRLNMRLSNDLESPISLPTSGSYIE